MLLDSSGDGHNDASELPGVVVVPSGAHHSAPSNTRMVSDVLSGLIFSPISQLATYHKAYLPGVLHHYIHNLTIPIPELDGSAAGPLFRAAWVPLVIHNPVIFQIVVLFAATHYATYVHPRQAEHMVLELLALKQAALTLLIQRVASEQNVSDVLVAAAGKMASYEAIFGTAESVSCILLHATSLLAKLTMQFHVHMSTVVRLLDARGGIQILGLDGFLAKLLEFIDINSAFLLGTMPYLGEYNSTAMIPVHRPFQEFETTLNGIQEQASAPAVEAKIAGLERFLGIMNVQL